jgi:hypothetical protein
MSATSTSVAAVDPIMTRLESEIDWYNRNSLASQRAYKAIKLIEIIAAAMIPLLALSRIAHMPAVTGSLGALITVLEGVLQLNHYHENWISYRSSCEALKHEKYLYLGKASPYSTASDAHALLAERIESLVSQETTKWYSSQQQESKAKAT